MRFFVDFPSGTTWNSRLGSPPPMSTMASGSPGWSSSCSGRSNTCDQKVARAYESRQSNVTLWMAERTGSPEDASSEMALRSSMSTESRRRPHLVRFRRR
jgi:hypothetical protein